MHPRLDVRLVSEDKGSRQADQHRQNAGKQQNRRHPSCTGDQGAIRIS